MNISFNPKVAQIVGVNAAILFEELCALILHSETNEVNFKDNRYWSYQSYTAIQKIHFYLTERQIQTAINDLEINGFIVSGNFNVSPFDKTKWYAIGENGFNFYEERAGFKVHRYTEQKEEVIEPTVKDEQDEEQELFALEADEEPVDEQEQEDENSVLPFNEFWKRYGKKVGRTKCEHYYKTKVSESDREKILKVIDEYVNSTPDKQYRKNPESWLHQRGWEDECISRTTTFIDKTQEGF